MLLEVDLCSLIVVLLWEGQKVRSYKPEWDHMLCGETQALQGIEWTTSSTAGPLL